MKTQIVLFLFMFGTIAAYAHEEPPKTLNEKKEKETAKKKISSSGIKKAVVWKYSVTDNNVSEKGIKVFVQEYDKTGNLVAIEAWKNDSLSERVEYSYDNNRNMLTDTDFSGDHEMLEKNEYIYDKEGRVSSGKSFDEARKLSRYFNIEKTPDKKTVTFTSYTSDDSLEYRLEYKYSSDFDNEDYREANKYDADGKLIMRVTKEFNLKGKATEKAVFGENNSLLYTFYFEYDNNGNTTGITKKLTDGIIEWKDEYTNDLNGNCTGIKSFNNDGKQKSYISFIYEYYQNE